MLSIGAEYLAKARFQAPMIQEKRRLVPHLGGNLPRFCSARVLRLLSLGIELYISLCRVWVM